VGPAEIEFSSAQNKVFIHIPIEEGPRYRISRIAVAPGDGHKLLGSDKLNLRSAAGDAKADAEILAAHLKLVKSRAGEWFNRSRMARDLQTLTTRYRDMGYAHANVIPFTQIDDEKRTIDVEFRIRPGKKVYIERIEIAGNSKTQDKVIRRELVIYEGDLYSHTRIEASRRAIFRLGFFKDVKVEPRKGSAEDASILKFTVAEGSTGTFNIGAGYSTVENLVAQLQVTQQNLFGRGQTLMLQGQLSSLRQYFSLRFVEPYFFDTKWYSSFSLYNSLYSFESFNRKTMGGSLTWGYALSPLWRVFLTYTLEDVDINTSSSGVLLGSGSRLTIPSTAFVANLFKDGVTSSMRASITYDKRDNRQFPTKGAMHSLSAEFARPEFGSQNVFDRYRAFTRLYFPLFNPFIFKMNAEIGLITSTDAAGVPIFERFFLGGINTVRGFRPYSLGPKIQIPVSPDPNAALFSFRKGGDKSLVFNWELEFDILKAMMIKGVLFIDAGNAYDDDQDYSLTKMRSSWGFGIRWYTFLGTLRFEWGLPFSPLKGEDKVVFEFNIGGSF
jgi:outer membrane protein insertion porin family